ncbi:Alpha-amylase [Hordeum vulgare]|nr:Alpha-amylase [Hordeum vulgare]
MEVGCSSEDEDHCLKGGDRDTTYTTMQEVQTSVYTINTPLCGVEGESSFHALVSCLQARILWVNMRRRWPLPGDSLLIDNAKEWFMHLLNSSSDEDRDMLIMLIWRIWHLRNDKLHGKDAPPVPATVEFLDSYYKSTGLVGRYSHDDILTGKMSVAAIDVRVERVTNPPAPWPVPPPNRVALSVDGSFRETDSSTAAVMVLRDSEGVVIFATYMFIFHCNDPLEAELHATMQGMALAIRHSNLPVVLRSNSSKALSSSSTDGLSLSAYGSGDYGSSW